MECPFCGSDQIIVVNSRSTRHGSEVWRRRKCLKCEGVFTSYEKMDLSHLVVIKKSGKRQRFNHAKLFAGIYSSAIDRKHADKGDMGELSEEITNETERQIVGLRKKEIRSEEITEIILSIMAKKAPDLFLRFLAYREGVDTRKETKLLKKYFK